MFSHMIRCWPKREATWLSECPKPRVHSLCTNIWNRMLLYIVPNRHEFRILQFPTSIANNFWNFPLSGNCRSIYRLIKELPHWQPCVMPNISVFPILNFPPPHVCVYGVTVPQPSAERVSQLAERDNIIATNLTLILVDKNQKIPARVSISHLNNCFDENTLPHNILLYIKAFLSKKFTDMKLTVDQFFPKFSNHFKKNSAKNGAKEIIRGKR